MPDNFDRHGGIRDILYKVQKIQRGESHKQQDNYWDNCSDSLKQMGIHGDFIYQSGGANSHKKISDKSKD